MDKETKTGVWYALAAYLSWGFFPLFWKLLSGVDALQLLACRIVFSLLFVWILLAVRKEPGWPKILLNPKLLISLAASALLISINWGVYIGAVNSGHTVEASLGYYINPLVSVFLGLVFFKEKLKKAQWVAVALAVAGVIFIALKTTGRIWISLTLALSFGLYGLFKKKTNVDSLVGLASETLILSPLALGWLAFQGLSGKSAFSGGEIRIVLLAVSGVITALPLLWFALGARRLPLSLLGFIQFINPCMQLGIGVLVFHEPFTVNHAIAFALIWAALIVYTLSLGRPKRREAGASR
jgi:chloramphenicol-sensitive protein RarD